MPISVKEAEGAEVRFLHYIVYIEVIVGEPSRQVECYVQVRKYCILSIAASSS